MFYVVLSVGKPEPVVRGTEMRFSMPTVSFTLSAYSFGNNGDAQSFAGGINGCRSPGGTSRPGPARRTPAKTGAAFSAAGCRRYLPVFQEFSKEPRPT